MKRKFWAILLITFLLIPQIAHALSYEQVTQKAKEITVLIDGCNSSSGVLYQHQGNTYYVLTAKHVVENRNVNCLVITPDGLRYETNIDKISIPLSGIDLAVLQFTSERNYTLAEFGDSQKVTGGKTVYVAGAPEPTSAIPKRTLLVTPGNIVGIQPPQNGYEFIYNNSTRRGMSGGALLDENGKVIDIHGQGDQQEGSKTGLNLAIPSQTFLAAQLPNPTIPPVTPP